LDISETGQIIVGICLLIVVYVLTRRYHAWRMSRVYQFIIKDLEQKGAVDPASAVDLLYARKSMFRIGTKDYRPKVLEYMTLNDIVGMTGDAGYYLKERKSETRNLKLET